MNEMRGKHRGGRVKGGGSTGKGEEKEEATLGRVLWCPPPRTEIRDCKS